MANKTIKRGLSPVPREGGQTPTRRYTCVSSSGVYDWFIGSAFEKVASGEVDSAGTTDTDLCTGAVVVIYDAAGFPITNVAKNTAGITVEGSYLPDQIYAVTLAAAGTAADLSKLANLTAETATVGTSAYGSPANPGSPYSLRQLDTPDTSTEMFTIMGLSDLEFDNDITEANCEVYVRITTANYVI